MKKEFKKIYSDYKSLDSTAIIFYSVFSKKLNNMGRQKSIKQASCPKDNIVIFIKYCVKYVIYIISLRLQATPEDTFLIIMSILQMRKEGPERPVVHLRS